MVLVTLLSLSSSSPRAISSDFIHTIILQRGSGRPAAQPKHTFPGRRDSLAAFCWTVLWGMDGMDDGEEDERGGTFKMTSPAEQNWREEMQEGPVTQNLTACCLIWLENSEEDRKLRQWQRLCSARTFVQNKRRRGWVRCCRNWWWSDAEAAWCRSSAEASPVERRATGQRRWRWRTWKLHSNMHAAASAHIMMVWTCTANTQGEVQVHTISWSNSDIQCGWKA